MQQQLTVPTQWILAAVMAVLVREESASVIITQEIPSYAYLPYSFGSNLIEQVIINGQLMIKKYNPNSKN